MRERDEARVGVVLDYMQRARPELRSCLDDKAGAQEAHVPLLPTSAPLDSYTSVSAFDVTFRSAQRDKACSRPSSSPLAFDPSRGFRMNAEAAQQALDIARRHYDSGNIASGIRFAKKSIALGSSPEAVALLSKLERAEATGSSSATSASAGPSTASSRPTARASTTKSASPPAQEKARDFTPAQAALVKRVKACRVTQYYEILALEKGCSDSDVKKAYRKVRTPSFVAGATQADY